MLGLFGTLNLTTRSLQVQQQGIETAGHNMANVNNPAYARQKVAIATTSPIATEHGFEGTGADVATIGQVRDAILDNNIVTEGSVTGSLTAQQQALQYAQSDLAQQIDRSAAGAEGAAAAAGTGTQHGIGDAIDDLFKSFQSLSTQPSSMTERDLVLSKAQTLAQRFNQTDSRLASLSTSISDSVTDDVKQANQLLDDIAKLNQQIGHAEMTGTGTANDLRDARQAKLESLGNLVKFDALPSDNGAVDISIGGLTVIDGVNVREHLESYDAGNGRTMVRSNVTGTNLDIPAGHIHGLIDARDTTIAGLRSQLSNLASSMITQVNMIHQGGFGLNGATGENFFSGTDASNIGVNKNLTAAGIQASDTQDAAGNNGILIALGKLQRAPQDNLGKQTFSQNYARVVSDLGDSLSTVNQQLTDQGVVTNMLKSQRDSVSAVNLDEEMTDLVKYQKAYQASAQVVNVINQMLDTVLNMMH